MFYPLPVRRPATAFTTPPPQPGFEKGEENDAEKDRWRRWVWSARSSPTFCTQGGVVAIREETEADTHSDRQPPATTPHSCTTPAFPRGEKLGQVQPPSKGTTSPSLSSCFTTGSPQPQSRLNISEESQGESCMACCAYSKGPEKGRPMGRPDGCSSQSREINGLLELPRRRGCQATPSLPVCEAFTGGIAASLPAASWMDLLCRDFPRAEKKWSSSDAAPSSCENVSGGCPLASVIRVPCLRKGEVRKQSSAMPCHEAGEPPCCSTLMYPCFAHDTISPATPLEHFQAGKAGIIMSN